MSQAHAIPPISQVEQIDPTRVRWGGGIYTYFGGCDYLRLSWCPKIRKRIAKEFLTGVSNVGASRTTTGEHEIYARAEGALRNLFGVPDALLVGNGYAANLVVGQTLAGEFDRILIDEKAHPSLRDTARLAGVVPEEFAHRSVNDLRRKLRRRKGRVLLMTDAVFAPDGAISPLSEYLHALPERGILLADDAHGAGVLGEGGRGSGSHWAIDDDRLIQTITLSKAFGVSGGAVLGEATILRRIRLCAGAYLASTPLAPPLASGVIESVRMMERGSARRRRLRRNMNLLGNEAGIPSLSFPVLAAVSEQVDSVITELQQAGIHPPFIKYPGGQSDGFFRFSISSEHTVSQLKGLGRLLRPLLSEPLRYLDTNCD